MLRVRELLEMGRNSSACVGIGCSHETADGVSVRLRELKSGVQLVPYEDEEPFLCDLEGGRITVAVRGTLSSSRMMKGIKDTFGLEDVKRAALLEDRSGNPFLLAPVGIDEGRDYGSRLSIARSVLGYFSDIDWKLRVGVLSIGRTEDAGRNPEIKASLEEGGRIADELVKEGHDAKHYSILIEDAARECDLVIAPDGVSGNLIFRTLHFLGGCKAYGAPVVNLHKAVFIDTSRAKVDFTDSVLLAAGLDIARR